VIKHLNPDCNILIFKYIIIGIALIASFSGVTAQDDTKSHEIQSLYDSANHYNNIGDYEQASYLLKKAIEQKKNFPIDNAPEYFKIYNRLGIIYRQQGNFQMAVEYYKKSLANTFDEFNQSVINGNIANIYSLKGDYLKAIDFHENALIALQQSNSKSKHYRIVQNFHNQGFAYKKLENYPLALQKYLESIKIANENGILDIGDTYYNCGRVYEKMDSPDKAKEFLVKAVDINTNIYGKNNLVSIMSNMNLANFFVNRYEFDKAAGIYSKAYINLKKTVGNKHPYISIYYKHIGDMYSKMRDYQQALRNYQQALIIKTPGFNDTSLLSNPSLETIPDMDLLEILKNKSNALVKLSELENRESNLKSALSTLELTIKFIEQLRMGYLNENSKLVLAENEHETYMSIIKISYELLTITKDKEYSNIAFKYSERSKYAILRESINEESARSIASIPDSISNKEGSIKEQISNFRMHIESENKRVHPDSLKLIELKEKLFQLTQTQEKIIKDFEQNYPKYYKRKYENRVVEIPELQSTLSEKEAVISYELTDSILYTHIITGETQLFDRYKVDSAFFEHLRMYREFLHSEYESGYVKFRISSYELYKTLISRFENELNGKNLLIIPDSKMTLIAFESLTTEPYIEKKYADYATEPYLIRKYPIGYIYSATLFTDSKENKKRSNQSFLGFAPDYKNFRDSLESMPLSPKYLKRISRFIRGKVFTGENATEHNFKKNTHKYGIIHLFAHGSEDSDNPDFSKMYFSYRNDTIEDGYLHAYELDEMEINANLIVLASCYSGSGAINKSEGALSIGRSFLNTGNRNPSLIISLWAAAYESTLFETSEFYKYLFRGKRIDEALQISKLNYLKQANPLQANPKNWANLISTGNQDALFKGYYIKIVFISLFIILCIIFAFIKVRKRINVNGAKRSVIK
jgi:CHAT domain-containing protein/Tfp pilus assembly protein PilF